MIYLSRHWKTKEFIPETGMKSQPWRIYSPGQDKEFRISRSGVSDFINCPRCFYLNKVQGLKDIDTIPFTLNNTVDELVKREFDQCREKQISHEVMVENKLDAVPFQHDDLNKWRNSRTQGVEYHHKKLNLLLAGGIDDVWMIKNSKPVELIMVDYKAQAKKDKVNDKDYLEDKFHQGYKFQLEFYRYLFTNIGFEVYPNGYFLVYNAVQDRKEFGTVMKFERSLVKYKFERSVDEIEKIVQEMKKVMDGNKIPKSNTSCQNCAFIRAGSKFLNGK